MTFYIDISLGTSIAITSALIIFTDLTKEQIMFDLRYFHQLFFIVSTSILIASGCIVQHEESLLGSGQDETSDTRSEMSQLDEKQSQGTQREETQSNENQTSERQDDENQDDENQDDENQDVEEKTSITPQITVVQEGEGTQDLSYFSSEVLGETTSYMIGIEQTDAEETGDDYLLGDAFVFIEEQQGPVTLVLNSHESATWHLDGPGVSQIQDLIIIGYYEQAVRADALNIEPQIFDRTKQTSPDLYIQSKPEEGTSCKNFDLFDLIEIEKSYPENHPDQFDAHEVYREDLIACEYFEMIDFLETLDIHAPHAFAGTYQASHFLIHSTLDNTSSSLENE